MPDSAAPPRRTWTPDQFLSKVGGAIGAGPDFRASGALGPVEACRWTHPAAHETPVEALDAHFVAFVLGGPVRVRCRVEGERERAGLLSSGRVTVVPAGRGVQWSVGGPMTVLNVFAPDQWVHGLGGGLRPAPRLGAADAHAERLALLILDAIRAPAPDPLYGEALAAALFARLSGGAAPGAAGSAPRDALTRAQLRRAREFMADRLEEPITLSAIAAAAGVSTFHFARGFRTAMGAPPHRHLVALRVARAKALLCDTRMPLAEVAAASGMGCASGLARTFKREVGATPSEYRRAVGSG